jgi:hypothetical protein
MKNAINKIRRGYLALALVLFAALAASPVKADDVTDAITDTSTLVTGYVTAIGGVLTAVAVLWLGISVGVKYIGKLRRL